MIASFNGLQQLVLLVDPVLPIEIVSVGNPIPDPLVLTTDDLSGAANGEQWEGLYVMIENVTMTNNQIGGDVGSFTDNSGTGYISEYFQYFDDQFIAGINPWPSAGTRMNLTGFVREEAGTPGQIYSVNPRNDDDIEFLSAEPLVKD